MPPALGDYCAKADWPDGWAARDALPHRANFGLLLRWHAALFELGRFVSIPEEKIAAVMTAFAEAVRMRLERDPAFDMLDARPIDRTVLRGETAHRRWDEISSILSFYLRHPHDDRVLTASEAEAVYRGLAAEQCGLASIRLGQPVRCADIGGEPASALRLCLSAPLIAEASESPAALEGLISRAMTALDRTAQMVAQLSPAPAKARYA